MVPATCATTVSFSGPTRVGDRHTVPARGTSVGGIPSRATGLPEIMTKECCLILLGILEYFNNKWGGVMLPTRGRGPGCRS